MRKPTATIQNTFIREIPRTLDLLGLYIIPLGLYVTETKSTLPFSFATYWLFFSLPNDSMLPQVDLVPLGSLACFLCSVVTKHLLYGQNSIYMVLWMSCLALYFDSSDKTGYVKNAVKLLLIYIPLVFRTLCICSCGGSISSKLNA